MSIYYYYHDDWRTGGIKQLLGFIQHLGIEPHWLILAVFLYGSWRSIKKLRYWNTLDGTSQFKIVAILFTTVMLVAGLTLMLIRGDHPDYTVH